MLGAWILSSRVPGWLVLPPVMFLGWNLLGAMPLYLLWEPIAVGAALAAAQCLLAVLLVMKLRATARRRLWLKDKHLPRRANSVWQVLRRCAATGLTLTVIAVLHAPLWLALGIGEWTDGFVAFDREAVLVERRRFESGGQTIELVAMMHLGEDASYRQIYGSFSAPGTVVLIEGVTDRDGRLAGVFSYDRLAASVGLTAQPPLSHTLRELSMANAEADPAAFESPATVSDGAPAPADGLEGAVPPSADALEVSRWPHLQHADVDAGAFSDETIAFLEHLGTLLRPRSATDLLALLGTEIPPDVQDDLIALRNTHLIEQLDFALDRYDRIIIPWGALHLPAIQVAIEARGFELSAVSRQPIIRYRTLMAAIAARLRR
jgi:hypothetical protein